MRKALQSFFGSGLLLMIAGAAVAQGSQGPQVSSPPEAPPGYTKICGQLIRAPQMLPPPGSPPVIWLISPCFDGQGGRPSLDIQTYLGLIKLQPSSPSNGVWVPYDNQANQTIEDDFRRLWESGLLRDLGIEVSDYPFTNGVVGKIVVYRMRDR